MPFLMIYNMDVFVAQSMDAQRSRNQHRLKLSMSHIIGNDLSNDIQHGSAYHTMLHNHSKGNVIPFLMIYDMYAFVSYCTESAQNRE